MSRTGKIFVGFLSFWPLAYMFLFMGFIVFNFFGPFATGASQSGSEPFFAVAFPVIFVLHMGTIFLTFGLSGFYIYRFFKDDEMDEKTTLLWSVFVFMGNMLAFPVVWYLHLWSDESRIPGLFGDDDGE